MLSLGVVGAMTVAFFAGGMTARDQLEAKYASAEPDKQHVKIIETEIVKREQVPTMPESCARAVELAKTVADAFTDYSKNHAELKGVTQDLATAIFTKNISSLNKATVKLNNYDSASAGIADTLVQSVRMLNEANAICIQDVNK